MSRFAIAMAAATGWPPNVIPCANIAVPSMNGSAILSCAITASLGPSVGVRVRHVAAAGREWLELRPQAGDAGGGERAECGAVVGDLARDHLDALALAVHAVPGAAELHGGFDRLGPARGEEDA